jgi:RNA polymerase sigma-70 factor (ECF subfamily)
LTSLGGVERDSFEAFYRAKARQLHRYAAAVAGRGSADDACQEAWLRMWRAWGSADDTRLDAWARQVVRNCCMDDLRHQRPVTTGIAHDDVATDPSPDDVVLSRSEASALSAQLARLSPSLRQVLWLREVVGLSYAEISESLDIPIGTVMSRLHAARRRLARRLRL